MVSDRAVVEGWWAGLSEDLRAQAHRFVWGSGVTVLPDRLRSLLLVAGLLEVSVRRGDPADRLVLTMPAEVRAHVLAQSD